MDMSKELKTTENGASFRLHMMSIDHQFEQYLRDESRTLGTAKTISFPTSESEIAAIVSHLNETQTPITVQGGRTGLAAGAIPEGGHVMNLTKMNNITGMAYDEMAGLFYLEADPGVVLSELNKQISKRNFKIDHWTEASKVAFTKFCEAEEYFFKPDPTETSATLGGMAACNASGARSYAYGATRDHIKGIRVVLATGEILALSRGEYTAENGKLVLKTIEGREIMLTLPTYKMPKTKNASGYYIDPSMDAVDLFIGSDGTLGIITSLTLVLYPLPEHIWGMTCFFEKEQASIDFVNEIRTKVQNVVAIEYFDGAALKILSRQRDTNSAFSRLPEINTSMAAACFLEIHEHEEAACFETLKATKKVLDGINSLKQSYTKTLSWVARTDADRAILRFFRHAVPESVNMLIDERKKIDSRITKLGTDMSVPDEALNTVYAMYRDGLKANGLESAIWGHIGNNHLHVNILPRNIEDFKTGKELYAKWAKKVTDLGGAVSAEHGVGKLKRDFLTVMYGEHSIEEMRALKKALDPNALLGRGNLFAHHPNTQKKQEA